MAVFARSIVPLALNYLTNVHVLLQAGQQEQLSRQAKLATSGLTLVLLATCAAIAIPRIRERLHLSIGSMALLSLAGYQFFRVGVTESFGLRATFTFATFGLVLLALSIVPVSLLDLRLIGAAGFGIAIYSIFLANFLPRFAFLHQYVDELGHVTKALIGTALLAGPMTHSNTLGVFLALTVPFVFLFERRALTWASALTILFAIVWSASRTSLIALAVMAAYFLIWRVAAQRARSRSLLAWLVVTAGTASVGALPLLIHNPDALSGRVQVWSKSVAQLRESGATTFGVGHWTTSGELNTNALELIASSAHNLAVQLLVTGGIVGIALGLATLFAIAKRAIAADLDQVWPVMTGYLIVFLVISSTEFVLVFSSGETLFPVTVVVLLLILNLSREATSTSASPLVVTPAAHGVIRRGRSTHQSLRRRRPDRSLRLGSSATARNETRRGHRR